MAPTASLPTRKLGKTGREISALGLGLMGLSIAYGSVGTDEKRFAVLDRAFELGCTNWDSSDLYGDSEDLLGKWFALHPERRADIFLATKFAVTITVKDNLELEYGCDSSPEYARTACERSLKRLGVDFIDLYYIHRLDAVTPIEKTMEALAELKREGKIKAIGISECSSNTVRRAYKIAPVDAVQVEYNPWQLDIENATSTNLLATCRELGVSVFAYSPLGRGFLTGQIRSINDFEATDFRRILPRFSPENFPKNLELVKKFEEMAAKKGCSSGQLALAWLLAQGNDIIPIPGTKKIKYLEENVAAAFLELTSEEDKEIRAFIESIAGDISGERAPENFFTQWSDSPEL
ncbi:Aldo/keto reductase-like protein [Podospora didyma]|uniref:Aldo/keto reductase-like protein n=1 Tax=Podospora didyma TaxID=330526 RepID=A0AAE0NQ23_9PEZI|nr:Aldo/keto reductase-like protein [Podospora didyma]